MKKIMFGLMVLGLTNPMFAQYNPGAMQNLVLNGNHFSQPIPVNSKYLNDVGSERGSTRVKNFEKLIAMHNIESHAVYQPGLEGTYKVEFKDADNMIKVVYDSKGVILRTEEKYHNIILPLPIRISLIKEYPGWSIYENEYRVRYNSGKELKNTCKVSLKKGDKIITLKIDVNDPEILNDETGI
ncbi:MAG TPA: hypothetical protein VKN36_15540 [Eudoraea sp.]|nr:hypothetical protein [Eudoraea sp.]